MGVLLAFVAGVALWIVLWALGVKSLDAFMITILITLIALAGRIVSPFLPGNRE